MSFKTILWAIGSFLLSRKENAAEAKITGNKGISVGGGAILLYSLILFGLGVGISLLLLTKCPGPASAPPAVPDTTSMIVYDTITGKFIPPEIDGGEAKPTRDTIYKVKFAEIPWWWIQVVDYRDNTLKIGAVRQLPDSLATEETRFEAYAGTWYTPDGFQIRVNRTIHVDTFPRSPPKEALIEKKDFWHWEIDAGASLVTASVDTFSFKAGPYFAARGVLGPLRIGKTYWSLIPGQVELSHGVLGYTACLRVRF